MWSNGEAHRTARRAARWALWAAVLLSGGAPVPRPPSDPTTGWSFLAVALAVAGTALVASALGWLAGRMARRTPTPATEPPRSDGLVDDLVDGLIAGYDLATSDGQRARALAALRRAGVSVLEPAVGDVFDPAAHLALGTQQATKPDQVGRVARTERPGWRRHDELVRHPEVVVWR